MKTLLIAAIAVIFGFSAPAWAQSIGPTGGGSLSGPAAGDLSGTYPNPSVASLNNASVTPSFGSTFRTLMAVTGETYSVLDWPGVVGNSSNDDTTGMQNAVTYVAGIGGKLMWPCVTGYKISAAINVPFGVGFDFGGAARGCVQINQATSNTPIFHLTGNLTHDFAIHDFITNWTTAQSSSNTSAVSLYFDGGSNTPQFNMDIYHIDCLNGYRCISNNNGTNGTDWGIHFHDSTCGGSMTGACFYDIPNPAVGNPRLQLDNIFITATGATEPSIQLAYNDSCLLQSVEIDGGDANVNTSGSIITGTQANCVLDNVRSEGFNFRAASPQLIEFQQSYITARNLTVTGYLGTAYPELIASNGSATNSGLTILGENIGAGSMTGGTSLAYSAANILAVEGYNNEGNSPYVSTNLRQYLGGVPMPRLTVDNLSMDFTQTVQDASITVSARVTQFNAPLTALRTATLLNTGVADGSEFYIMLTSVSPYDLHVTDPVSGNNFDFAPGTTGYVFYRYTGGSYVIIGNGYFSGSAQLDEGGTTFTVTGGTSPVGSYRAGTFASSTSGTMSAVITMNGSNGLTANHGWDCHCTDLTTSADALLCKQTASSTTTATLGGTTVSGDTISLSCTPY